MRIKKLESQWIGFIVHYNRKK